LNREDYNKFRILLNIYDGKCQREDGSYRGFPERITDEDIKSHFEGRLAFAFYVDTSNLASKRVTARFAAIDIDQCFEERLPVFKETFGVLGLTDRCFITGGSSPTKGKIILPLIDGIAKDRVAVFLSWILKKAHSLSPALVPENPRNGDIELYPRIANQESDSAGVVRIAGRNIARGGRLEAVTTLDGFPVDFLAIKPSSANKISCVVRKLRGPLELQHPKRIRKAMKKGYCWGDFSTGVRGIYRQLISFAFYCRRRYKACQDALSQYTAIVEAIAHASPDLDNPSPKYKDQRNPLRRELEELNAWKLVQNETMWSPKIVSERLCGAKKVYDALCYIVACRELNRHSFAVTYDCIADVTGLSKRAVQKATRTAAKHGLVVLLHPGRSRGNKRHGLSAMYGLVGAGETSAHVWQLACQLQSLQDRYREAPVLENSSPSTLKLPTLEFWDMVRANKGQPQVPKPWALQEAERIVNKLNNTKAEAPC
jgi:hypothetical protein